MNSGADSARKFSRSTIVITIKIGNICSNRTSMRSRLEFSVLAAGCFYNSRGPLEP